MLRGVGVAVVGILLVVGIACGGTANPASTVTSSSTLTPSPTQVPLDTPTATAEASRSAQVQLQTAETDPTATPHPTHTPAPTSRPRPRPTPRPTRTPRPIRTDTPGPAPPEYDNAEEGIKLAWEELFGYWPGSEDYQYLDTVGGREVLIRNMYHIATAEPGSYNPDPSGYFEWVKTYLTLWFTPSSDAQRDSSRHLRQQVYIALTEPTSELGRTMRAYEAAAEAMEPGSGPAIYWLHLIGGPATDGLLWTPMVRRGVTSHFENLMSEYDRERRFGSLTTPDFAAFLTAEGFTSGFEPFTASQSPTPTPPQPSGSSNLPAGTVLYDRPLTDWRAESYETGWVKPSASSLHIGVYAGGGEHIIEAWTDRDDFADIDARVDVREASDDSAAAGCLAVRHDINAGDYSLCILGNDRSWATYNYVDDNGNWQVEVLLDDKIRRGTQPSAGWNTLQIVARGNRLEFIANGTVLGTATHDARTVGTVAVSVTSWDVGQDADFEFRNLVVRSAE